MIIDDLAKLLEHARNALAVGGEVLIAVSVGELGEAGVGREDLGYVLDPGHVLPNGRVGDLEAFLLRMEGDANADRFVVLGQHFPAKQRCHEGRDPLLAVYEDALAGRRCAILELNRGIAPCNQIADRVTLVQ